MKELLKKKGYDLLTNALTKVAAEAASKCCYYIYYQPKVPKNLNKFSKNKK